MAQNMAQRARKDCGNGIEVAGRILALIDQPGGRTVTMFMLAVAGLTASRAGVDAGNQVATVAVISLLVFLRRRSDNPAQPGALITAFAEFFKSKREDRNGGPPQVGGGK